LCVFSTNVSVLIETDVVVHIETEENEITTTQNHPFYVEGKGWTPASELEDGDVLHTKEGVTAVVQSIEVEQLDKAVKVYNLEVEDGHTYYVTDKRVLVHNDCGNKGGESGSDSTRVGRWMSQEEYDNMISSGK
jgi:intein/homing endonuclease